MISLNRRLRKFRDFADEGGGDTMAESTDAQGEKLYCAFCKDEITEQPIKRLGKHYCSEACAFEGTRPTDCSRS